MPIATGDQPATNVRLRIDSFADYGDRVDVQPFLDSTEALGDSDELRRRLRQDGYLFLRGLQDRTALSEVRMQVLATVERAGWMLPGSSPADGRVDAALACTEGDRAYADVYHEVQKLRSFHAVAHTKTVLTLLSDLFEGPAFVHPKKVGRLWFPQFTAHTTPLHQDYVHFQSNLEVLSVWTPLGDCPLELGPLAIVEGSHHIGKVIDHHFSLGAGALEVDGADSVGTLRCSGFDLGDTLVFGCLMVHGALPNTTEDRLRVSLDNRYQRRGLPISAHQLLPHLNEGRLTWEGVYAEWPKPDPDDLRYYWEREQLEVVPQDTSFSERIFEEALAVAAEGGEAGLVAMRRTVANAPASENARRARAILARYPEPVADGAH